ncbi:MAG: putative rane associated hydrolase, partial [Gemmatimonadetes bacterium]|nr:putative rane associated hydrolase [Gemmatimonadota bacterium]
MVHAALFPTDPVHVRSFFRSAFASSLSLSLLAAAAQAQRPTDTSVVRSTHVVAVPSATAAPRLGPIKIDGRIDEEAWSKATPITDFTQIDPEEGKPGTQRTEVRFLYDDAALYVAARMFDTAGPSGITTRLVRRD